MTVIVNGTYESINLYDITQVNCVNGKYLVIPNQRPIYNIPSGTTQLNARITTATITALQALNLPFQVVGDQIFASYDPIPTADLVIVTKTYKNAVRSLGGDTSKLAIPTQLVLGAATYGGDYGFGSTNLVTVGYLELAGG